MSTGLKANSDGSAAIQVGGSDAIQITSGLAATFVNNATVSGNLTVTGTLTASSGVSGAITSGTSVSASGTSITFTGIPSTVKRITVMLSGVSTSGTSPPQIQIGSGSVTTTGYLGSSTIVNPSPVSVLFTTGFGIGANTSNWAAGVVVHGAITLTLQTGNTWVCAGSVGRSDAASTYLTNGGVTLSGTLDRVRITTVNGTDTFDAGSINIFYE
jgi:hypothetical protein